MHITIEPSKGRGQPTSSHLYLWRSSALFSGSIQLSVDLHPRMGLYEPSSLPTPVHAGY
ncbi:rCG51641 [Rattus norvegicus]|uniref:RCG51641 n=1 Tax=Rattus norvegicus TaxID=10116 RepID=A6IZN3_RAT|nr:rCG51641 [Rattus norvegicus]